MPGDILEASTDFEEVWRPVWALLRSRLPQHSHQEGGRVKDKPLMLVIGWYSLLFLHFLLKLYNTITRFQCTTTIVLKTFRHFYHLSMGVNRHQSPTHKYISSCPSVESEQLHFFTFPLPLASMYYLYILFLLTLPPRPRNMTASKWKHPFRIVKMRHPLRINTRFVSTPASYRHLFCQHAPPRQPQNPQGGPDGCSAATVRVSTSVHKPRSTIFTAPVRLTFFLSTTSWPTLLRPVTHDVRSATFSTTPRTLMSMWDSVLRGTSGCLGRKKWHEYGVSRESGASARSWGMNMLLRTWSRLEEMFTGL